ncbi:uncharacterized protein LOC129734056 [Wyeomyia smithii]|uniref:uncharacterized protein LOC129734056 n=1 Tax=Wyeomyia smithii TaxID=174621 RepID=UPI002467D5CE|nr:uncharacterized protein LOC129734056 [Wyeomyia smithii]
MAPRKRAVKQKLNHGSYVHQLFQDFLSRNRQPAARVPKVCSKPIQPPLQHFHIDGYTTNHLQKQSNPFEFIKPTDPHSIFPSNGRKEQLHPLYAKLKTSMQNHRTKNGCVQRQKPYPVVSTAMNVVRNFFEPVEPDRGPREVVYSRFQRQAGTNQFVKREPSPSAPPGGLMRWLEKSKQITNRQTAAARKGREYYDLPSDFFSGRESLPFELSKLDCQSNADKTLASLGTVFVPPATSTPFDRNQSELVSILTDPEDFRAVTSKSSAREGHCEEFLRKVSSAMDNITSKVCRLMKCAVDNTALDRNMGELKALLQNIQHPETLDPSLVERSSWMEHSLVSNRINHGYRKCAKSPLLFNNSSVTYGQSNREKEFTVIDVQLGCERRTHKPLNINQSSGSFEMELFGSHPKLKQVSNWNPNGSATFTRLGKMDSPEPKTHTFSFDDSNLGLDDTEVDLSFLTQKSSSSSLVFDELTPPELEDSLTRALRTPTENTQLSFLDFEVTPSPRFQFPTTNNVNETFFEQFMKASKSAAGGEDNADSFFDLMLF